MIQSYFLEKSPIIAGHYQEAVQASAEDRWDAGFDMSMSRENPTIAAFDWARFHYKDDDEVIDKDVWDKLYARPDTEWHEGMTHYQAEVIRDEYDYNLKDQLYGESEGFNVAYTAGYFAGALLDPLNYLPWTRTLASTVRWISSSSKAMQFKRFINPLKAKAETKADDIIDAMSGSVIGESAIAGRKTSLQTDYDLQMGIMNVAMAGGIGAGVAGMRKVQSILNDKSLEETVGSAGKAMDDFAKGEQVSVDGGAPPRQQVPGEAERTGPIDQLKEGIESELDLLVQEPTVKAVADQFRDFVKKAPRAFTDFVNCRIK